MLQAKEVFRAERETGSATKRNEEERGGGGGSNTFPLFRSDIETPALFPGGENYDPCLLDGKTEAQSSLVTGPPSHS